MISVSWRLAHHPQDQQLLDAFKCAIPTSRASAEQASTHPEPYAEQVQKILRGKLYQATRNSKGLNWRYLVAIDDDDLVAAALVHLSSPQFAEQFHAGGLPARLLLAIAVRVDLRGVGVTPHGVRLIDDALAQAIADARVDTGGGVLFAEVHPDNHRMHAVLTRNNFEVAGIMKDAVSGEDYSIYVVEL